MGYKWDLKMYKISLSWSALCNPQNFTIWIKQATVFQLNSLGLKRKKTSDEVNSGNLYVYINRDTFLLWIDCSLEQLTIFDFLTRTYGYFPLSLIVHKWLKEKPRLHLPALLKYLISTQLLSLHPTLHCPSLAKLLSFYQNKDLLSQFFWPKIK